MKVCASEMATPTHGINVVKKLIRVCVCSSASPGCSNVDQCSVVKDVYSSSTQYVGHI